MEDSNMDDGSEEAKVLTASQRKAFYENIEQEKYELGDNENIIDFTTPEGVKKIELIKPRVTKVYEGLDEASKDQSINALTYQRKYLESLCEGESPSLLKPFQVSDYIQHNEFDDIIDIQYVQLCECTIPAQNGNTCPPLIKIIENGETYLIFLVFNCCVQVTKLHLKNGTMDDRMTFKLLNDETIMTMDAIRDQYSIYFGMGSINGIVYAFNLANGYKYVFKNHSDEVTSVKFCPGEQIKLLLSISKDCTIRLYSLMHDQQIAVYQDPFNFWLKGVDVSWHELGEKFVSVSDRGGYDLLHFFYLPHNEYYNQFSEVDKFFIKQQEKNEIIVREEAGDNTSDDDTDEKKSRVAPRLDCLSFYREYKNWKVDKIKQVEYFGDIFLISHPDCISFLAPDTEEEYIICKKIPIQEEIIEFKISGELLFIHTLSKVYYASMIDIIDSPELIVSDLASFKVPNQASSLVFYQRFTVSEDAKVVLTFDSNSKLTIYSKK
ncbi:unnamed protein product [Moneuplotes crassus]|uniref:Uncharacterized protein n=1 Tax=Euplotes crassus TaxID=5936 RepID=A0AAD1X9R0_EUPCR|nr:unnamed protein product [Moneuplotes crassus]